MLHWGRLALIHLSAAFWAAWTSGAAERDCRAHFAGVSIVSFTTLHVSRGVFAFFVGLHRASGVFPMLPGKGSSGLPRTGHCLHPEPVVLEH